MASYPRNYQLFPENALEPIKDDDDNMVFRYKFGGMQDFYDFLVKEPRINRVTWKHKDFIASVQGNYDFAGESYDDALAKLLKNVDPGYQEYLTIQKQLRARSMQSQKYKTIKSIAGGVVDPVAYVTGSPEIYRASRKMFEPKFITIDTQIAYNWRTTKEQVFNRALIITNLIHALEKSGYKVNVNSFMMIQECDEIITASFEIKKHSGEINYQALYKSLVDVEFFRRLCFRLIEITDVKDDDWPDGYGSTCDEDIVRKQFRLKKDDIYFDQPRNMGIYGNDVGEDFEHAVKMVGLDHAINIEKEKEIIRDSVKVLTR